MGKSIRDIVKKPIGRPKTTGPGTGVLVKMHDAHLDAIDDWIAKQKNVGLTRPEAIRRLVELGLTVKGKVKPKQPAAVAAERAKELAAKTIDKMSDDLASAVDQAGRKRRLLKGPEEFREHRVDRPKAKK